MNKTIYKYTAMLLAVGMFTAEVQAQADSTAVKQAVQKEPAPTIVWGEAKTASGGEDEAVIEQNPQEGNPLGTPIVDENPVPTVSSSGINPMVPTDVVKRKSTPQAQPQKTIAPVIQSTDQGVEKPWQEPLPQPSNKIENELYQSGNDIIDVQAYPIKDVSTVTEPNIQPTIITQ